MAKVYLLYFDFNTGGTYAPVHHGLASIAGTLKSRKHGVWVRHLEKETDFEGVSADIKRINPDIIGISFTTNQKRYTGRFLETFKPGRGLIIAGGVHCTLVKERIFDEFPQINGICIGEGELPLAELCRRFDNKEDYYNVESFYFKAGGRTIKNPVAALCDIDSLALPDYSFFYGNKAFLEGGGHYQMLISRGCPFNCNYCCNHVLRKVYPNPEKYVRFPSPDRALEIIKNNLAVTGNTKSISFVDDLFTWNKSWLLDFCAGYKKELDVPFVCLSRVELMDEEIAKSLKDAGCTVVYFGVESGNEWMRRNIMDRNHSNEAIKKAFMTAVKYGLKTYSYNMFGLPFETKEMQKDTINLNLSLQSGSGTCFYFFPYPGTRLYELCSESGLLMDNIDAKSGYFEGPALKETHVSHKETRKNFQALQLFYYYRLLIFHTDVPLFMDKCALAIMFMVRKAIFPFCDISTKNIRIKMLIKLMRRMGLRLMRVSHRRTAESGRR